MLHAVAALVPAARTSVPRPRLADRLVEGGAPVVVIAAPAGYGKTTLLDEWERRDPRPFARLTLGAADDDPQRLAERLERAQEELRAAPASVLALDGVHVLRSDAALAELRALMAVVAPGSALALASRTVPAVGLARLRANRGLLEIGARELVMTPLEAGALLTRARVPATPETVEALVGRTEGWPAGLALAAVAIAGEDDAQDAAARFGGDDAIVGEYVRDELLGALPAGTLDFLVRASVLDELSGPVCDAVLGTRASARRLTELGREALLLVPLDRTDTAYRCHRLVRDVLRAELRRREPGTEPGTEQGLHARAATWFERRDDPERALGHAAEAGDAERAARLLRELAPAAVTPLRDRALRRSLDRFTEAEVLARPALALAAANGAFLRGDADEVQRCAAVAERATAAQPDDRSAAGARLLRALLAADGLAAMGEDAAGAAALEPSDSPWRALCLLLEGVALDLAGDCAAAERRLEEAVRRAAVAAPNVQTLCLAQLALIAAERGEWETAAAHVARATAQVDHYGLGAQPSTALVFAADAMVSARRGRVEEAQAALRHGQRLLSEVVDFAPWYEAEARIALARAALRLSDLARARELLAQAARHVQRIPDPGVLVRRLGEAGALGDAAAASAVGGPAALTTAELRVLTFLPTHLSFREIADRLYVSANTVKTQAHAIYRKLDAASRSQAVTRATELGLLSG